MKLREADVLRFTVYGKPMPQGSMKAFVVGGKARLTATNAKMKPYRQEVAQVAALECRGRMIEKHVPVGLALKFYFAQPPSCPKSRTLPSVKPDLDKLARLVNDALTGIAYADDGQVCSIMAMKFYGIPERTEIEVRSLEAR